jgi:hypothetical protein
MTPMIVTTDMAPRPRPFEQPRRTAFRLRLPLILVWLLLAPFLIVLSPLLLLGLAVAGLDPFRSLGALLGLLAALGGTRIEVDTPDALVDIHLI